MIDDTQSEVQMGAVVGLARRLSAAASTKAGTVDGRPLRLVQELRNKLAGAVVVVVVADSELRARNA
jgi:hypothetical protein